MAIVDGKIRCTGCLESKSASAFAPSFAKRGHGMCRPCQRAYAREWALENPEKARAMRRRDNQRRAASPLLREKKNTQAREWARSNKRKAFERSCLTKFGLTLEDYDAMIAAQGGGCACCGRTVNKSGRRLGVDHDHRTGHVRGILCHHCNAGIGHLGDTLDGLRRAVAYLDRASHRPALRSVG